MSTRMPIPSNAALRAEPCVESGVRPRMASVRQPETAPGAVRLSIEQLRIEGLNLTSRQGMHLQHAVECELVRLLQAQPMSLRGGAITRLSAPSLSSALEADPDALGIEIARSLFAAMRDDVSGRGR